MGLARLILNTLKPNLNSTAMSTIKWELARTLCGRYEEFRLFNHRAFLTEYSRNLPIIMIYFDYFLSITYYWTHWDALWRTVRFIAKTAPDVTWLMQKHQKWHLLHIQLRFFKNPDVLNNFHNQIRNQR